ncbi:MAG: radical SAM protein [Candidatus Omnitrophica bacterium]|nr:radical SAM protein [Candidatus Omnitrophota bacterium]
MFKETIHRLISFVTLVAFVCSSVPSSYAQLASAGSFSGGSVVLPVPGTMVLLSPSVAPLLLKGIKIDTKNPFRMDFILDTGDGTSDPAGLKDDAARLIKYFLASLTTPENDLWVNLSPYEKDRMVAEKFGQTTMGQDLLAQDYILKQLVSSLMYPERDLGRRFWNELYAKAGKLYGTTEIPVDTFHKVWIVPSKAEIFVRGEVAFVVSTHLKVMLESDYLALKENGQEGARDAEKISDVSSSIMRSLILPEIEKEVNEGESFANLRQIFYSMVLATWFKRNLRETLLGKTYVEKNKVNGIKADDLAAKEKIYQQYLKAVKVGVFNFIKEEYDDNSKEVVPRKYFSGGYDYNPDIVKGRRVSEKAMMIGAGEAVTGKTIVAQVFNVPLRSTEGWRETLNENGLGAEPEFKSLSADVSAPDALLAVIRQLERSDAGVIRKSTDDDGNTIYSVSESVRLSPSGQIIERLILGLSFSEALAACFVTTDAQEKKTSIIVGFEQDLDSQQQQKLKQELRYTRGGSFNGREYGEGMTSVEAANEVSRILNEFAMNAQPTSNDGFVQLRPGLHVWRPVRKGEGAQEPDVIHGSPANYAKVSDSIIQGSRKPRVLLVQSHITGLNSFNPPLGLYYLKSSLKKDSDAEVRILDLGVGPEKTKLQREAHLKKVMREFQPDIVGVSFTTASSSNAFRAADIARELDPNVIIAAGGPHPSAVNNLNMLKESNFDISFRQEGERSFCQFVNAIHRSGEKDEILAVKGFSIKYPGEIFDTGNPDVLTDIDALPFPAIPPAEMARYDVWIVNPANKAVPILTTRGCPFGCTFCSKGVFGRSLRKRSAENIVDEIRNYYRQGQRNFSFIDDGISSDRKWLLNLCKAIQDAGLDIRWRASIRTNTMNPELLRAMKRSGCIGVAFGIESGSQRILDTVIGKGTDIATNRKAIQMAKEAGIEEVRLFIMVGLPGETEWDVRQTIKFVQETDPTNIGLSVAVPMPGSKWGNNLAQYGTTILGKADDFYPYRKTGASGQYTKDLPPIVHRTEELDRDRIAHMYEIMRDELAEYMFEPEGVKSKFISSELAYGVEMLKEIGLGDLLNRYDLTPLNAGEKLAPMAELIRRVNYPRWRGLNRAASMVGQQLDAEGSENFDRENILGLIVMYLLSLALDAELDDNEIMQMAVNGAETQNPLLVQIGSVAEIAHAAYLLVEGRLSREQYKKFVDTNIKVVNIPQLNSIAKRLKNLARSMSRDDLVSLLKEADDSKTVNGEDLVLMDSSELLDPGQQEAVMLLKPPTTVGSDGKFNLPLIGAILDRIESFGCDVAGLRVLGGAYYQKHPDKLQEFYSDAYKGYQNGIRDPKTIRRIREIYDTPDFERTFKAPFSQTPIIPAIELVTKYGLTDEDVDQLWAPSRFSISIPDFERRYGIKVRIVEGKEAVSVENGEIAVPREMIIVESGVQKINWYEKKLPYGVNKVAISTSVFPVVHPRVNNGQPVIIVNGYVPGLFRAFDSPEEKRTIALLVRPKAGSGVSLKALREDLVGDENMPDRNSVGTLRRDAVEGILPVPEVQRPGLRGVTNLVHLSAGPLEALKEKVLVFEQPYTSTVFGQKLLESGYSAGQIKYLFSNPRVRSLKDGVLKEETLFGLTNKKTNEEALETIKKYFPPYRTEDPSATPSVSFDQHQKIIDAQPSLMANRLKAAQVRSPSESLTHIDQLKKEENRVNDRVGEELIKAGEIAVIIGAGGEGGRLVGYEVDDPTLRDKVHSTSLRLTIQGKDVEANLAEIRVAHIKGICQGDDQQRGIPVLVMGNDKNVSHIEQLWKKNGFYGLPSGDVSFYSQNGIYRFNPSKKDILVSGKVIKELEKVHNQKIEYGLIPQGTRFDPEKAVDEIMARNGSVGDPFRTDDGVISTKPVGHLEMLIQPFLNGRLAYLAERGCKVLVIPNGDDMGFRIDQRRLGHFYRSGKQMMTTLVEREEGQEGGFLFDVDLESNGQFKPQILEKDNVPAGFDFSQIRYISTNQNYFNLEGLFEFFLGGGSLQENLKRYFLLSQQERLELVNRKVSSLRFNFAVKPVRVGTDLTHPDRQIPIMSAAAQVERLIGDMSRLLTTEHLVVPRSEFSPIKTKADEQVAARMIEQRVHNGVPYAFRSGEWKSSEPAMTKDVGGIDLNPKYLDLLIQGNRLNVKGNQENADPLQTDGFSPIILKIMPVDISSILSKS